MLDGGLVRWMLCGAWFATIGCAASAPSAPPVAVVQVRPAATGNSELARWIAKLAVPAELESAAKALVEIGDPAAIDPLAAAWRREHKSVLILAIADLARPLEEYHPVPAVPAPPPADPVPAPPADLSDEIDMGTEDPLGVDQDTRPHAARPASWDRAAPVLIEAIEQVDDKIEESVWSAGAAVEAIGNGQITAGLDAAIGLARRPPSDESWLAQHVAVIALLKFDPTLDRVNRALIDVIERKPARFHCGMEGEDCRRDTAGQRLALGALGARRFAPAIPALLVALYRYPELFGEIRDALIAIGPPVVDATRRVLRGEDPEVDRFLAPLQNEDDCGAPVELPEGQCQAYSFREIQAARMLGELHDPAAAPDLLAALTRPELPGWRAGAPFSGTTQHVMILDALRNLGVREAAPVVKAIWETRSRDKRGDARRVAALGAHAAVARDTKSVAALWKLATARNESAELREAAEQAFAGLAREPRHLELLTGLARREHDAWKQAESAAAGAPKARAARAAKQLTDAWHRRGAATDAARAAPADPALARASTQADVAIARAQRENREATDAMRKLVEVASEHQARARRLEIAIASVLVAVRCKDDVACFGATLSAAPAHAFDQVKPYLADAAGWPANETWAFHQAEIDRAMLELGKRGPGATAITDAVIAALDAGTIHDLSSLELALTKIAPRPCDACVRGLTSHARTITRLHSYFVWAGRP